MPALELLIEPLKHPAGLFACPARTFDGDMIAALFGHYAEPPFDQREVLAALAEQHRGELIVLKGQHALGCGRFLGRGCGWNEWVSCTQGRFKRLPRQVSERGFRR